MLIDGIPTTDAEAVVSVFDLVVLRGFGVFEVCRSYGGVPFRLEAHLDRLERSATALTIPLPERARMRDWMMQVADEISDGCVRIILSGGGRDPSVTAPPRTIVIGEPLLEVPAALSLLPVTAPWLPATDAVGFPGVKWVSYAPNVASTMRARSAGFSDALLVSREGIVLEGPNFAVAWVTKGRIETPSLDLGILASITREVMLECAGALGIEVLEVRGAVERLTSADEVFVLSTVLQVRPVDRIGAQPIPLGPIAVSVARCLGEVVRAETGHKALGLP